MPGIFIFFFLAVACLIVVAIIYGAIAAKKRREELAGWSAQQGLSFSAGRVYHVDDAYPAFKCLREGSDRYAYNVMEGERSGRNFRAFDYHYETSSTDSKGNTTTTNYEFSAIILRSEVPLKPLLIRTENAFDRVAAFFGKEDINFESAEFSRTFHVASPDRKWAYDVLHQRAMEFLLAMPRFEIQFDGDLVMVHRSSTFSAQEFETAAKVAEGLLDGLPEYVKQQQTASG